jgi:hypothetical protein
MSPDGGGVVHGLCPAGVVGSHDMPPSETSQDVGSPSPPRERLPDWSGEFARQTAANALGTLIAALVIFLAGVILGVITDVPLRSVVAAASGLGTAILAFSVLADLKLRIDRRTTRSHYVAATSRPIRRARAAVDLTFAEHKEVKDLLDRARDAADRGDLSEAVRLGDEVQRRVDGLHFMAEEADRYADEAERINREHRPTPEPGDTKGRPSP